MSVIGLHGLLWTPGRRLCDQSMTFILFPLSSARTHTQTVVLLMWNGTHRSGRLMRRFGKTNRAFDIREIIIAYYPRLLLHANATDNDRHKRKASSSHGSSQPALVDSMRRIGNCLLCFGLITFWVNNMRDGKMPIQWDDGENASSTDNERIECSNENYDQ